MYHMDFIIRHELLCVREGLEHVVNHYWITFAQQHQDEQPQSTSVELTSSFPQHRYLGFAGSTNCICHKHHRLPVHTRCRDDMTRLRAKDHASQQNTLRSRTLNDTTSSGQYSTSKQLPRVVRSSQGLYYLRSAASAPKLYEIHRVSNCFFPRTVEMAPNRARWCLQVMATAF